jgi:hypothetical protein
MLLLVRILKSVFSGRETVLLLDHDMIRVRTEETHWGTSADDAQFLGEHYNSVKIEYSHIQEFRTKS